MNAGRSSTTNDKELVVTASTHTDKVPSTLNGASVLRVRPRVADVEVQVVEEDEDAILNGAPEWWAYVWVSDPGGRALAEIRITQTEDVEAWCDATGYEWPPDMLEKLRAHLPQLGKPRVQVELSD